MTGPFRPGELDSAGEPLRLVEQAQALSAARELEAAAMAADVRPTPGFSERVMAAVLSCCWNLSKLPKASSIALAKAPLGSPPFLEPIICQNMLWLR